MQTTPRFLVRQAIAFVELLSLGFATIGLRGGTLGALAVQVVGTWKRDNAAWAA
jgi:hypothetical protein